MPSIPLFVGKESIQVFVPYARFDSVLHFYMCVKVLFPFIGLQLLVTVESSSCFWKPAPMQMLNPDAVRATPLTPAPPIIYKNILTRIFRWNECEKL